MALGQQPALAANCESLTSLQLPNTTITDAQLIAATADVGSYCRVSATLRPSSDSDIKIEVWLPATGWNGKLEAVGNGGLSGSIPSNALTEAVRRNYAAAGTDTGHRGTSASFALDHPEKLIDFGYRAVHEMTVTAKSVITAFYGTGPRFSYWNGCSSGGKQGLMEAQRFPGDFDGIIAGDPVNYWMHQSAGALWIAQAVHRDQTSYIPPSKYPLIHKAAIQACDDLDGLKDGILEDPRKCKFDPSVLQCQGPDSLDCLTASQSEAARKIYAGASNPRTHEQISPPLMPGSESKWDTLAGPQPYGGIETFKYVVFKNPNWDYLTMNFDSDIVLADKTAGSILDASNPDLSPFFNRGGKLLQYHGWNDPLVSPLSSIQYYESVLASIGDVRKVQSAYRLFLVPGMDHCTNGEGATSFDMLRVLEQWVEMGTPTDRIVASRIEKGISVRTHPLCPYPQMATYNNSGSIDDASNFTCKAP
jgi:Tannase and feruloyl esterase